MKRRLPIGVPSNYSELIATYGESLTDAAKGLGLSVEELVVAARDEKLIERFNIEEHFPLRMSWDEACAAAGLSDEQWYGFLKNTKTPPKGSRLAWESVRPYCLNGEDGMGPAVPSDMEAVYWGADILRCLDFMDTHGLKRGRSTCPAVSDAFVGQLYEVYENVRRRQLDAAKVQLNANLAEMETETTDSWPKDLPRNDNELARMYSEYIFEQVRRNSKIKTEDELCEISQQVWLCLIKGKVLERFVETAKTRLPRTLTTADAIGYLGISMRQWKGAVEYSQKSDSFWFPLPINGAHLAEGALYLTEDIQTLDTSGFLDHARNSPRKHPEFSGRGFKSYLAMAVKNHFLNMLRTRTRRHKERGVDDRVVLTPGTSGTYHKAYVAEEDVRWEENLADTQGLDMEELIDLKSMLSRHDVDPRTASGVNVLDHVTRGLTIRSAVKYEQRQQVRVAV